MMASRGTCHAELFFVYDRTALHGEEGELEEAIIYYFPEDEFTGGREDSVETQHRIMQMMGASQVVVDLSGEMPSMVTLHREQIALHHWPKYTLAMAGPLSESPGQLSRLLDKICDLFTFFHGSIQRVNLQAFCRDEFFRKLMTMVWSCYLPFVRRFSTSTAALFHPLPYVQLPKREGHLFLQASHILQSGQRLANVLSGAILFNGEILCTQLEPSLTDHCLSLIFSPERSEDGRPVDHPAIPLPTAVGDKIPSSVRVLNVYVTTEQYDRLKRQSAGVFTSSCHSIVEERTSSMASDSSVPYSPATRERHSDGRSVSPPSPLGSRTPSPWTMSLSKTAPPGGPTSVGRHLMANWYSEGRGPPSADHSRPVTPQSPGPTTAGAPWQAKGFSRGLSHEATSSSEYSPVKSTSSLSQSSTSASALASSAVDFSALGWRPYVPSTPVQDGDSPLPVVDSGRPSGDAGSEDGEETLGKTTASPSGPSTLATAASGEVATAEVGASEDEPLSPMRLLSNLDEEAEEEDGARLDAAASESSAEASLDGGSPGSGGRQERSRLTSSVTPTGSVSDEDGGLHAAAATSSNSGGDGGSNPDRATSLADRPSATAGASTTGLSGTTATTTTTATTPDSPTTPTQPRNDSTHNDVTPSDATSPTSSTTSPSASIASSPSPAKAGLSHANAAACESTNAANSEVAGLMADATPAAAAEGRKSRRLGRVRRSDSLPPSVSSAKQRTPVQTYSASNILMKRPISPHLSFLPPALVEQSSGGGSGSRPTSAGSRSQFSPLSQPPSGGGGPIAPRESVYLPATPTHFGYGQSSSVDFGPAIDDLSDLKRLNLYVQSHSATTMVLIAEAGLQHDDVTIMSLFKHSLSQLGDLEVNLKHALDDELCFSSTDYSTLTWDAFASTLTSVNLPTNTERGSRAELAESMHRAAEAMHCAFLSSATITDVTLKSNQGSVYGRHTFGRETFFQQRPRPGTMSWQGIEPATKAFSLEQTANTDLERQFVLLL